MQKVVTEKLLRDYLLAFHGTYKKYADQRLQRFIPHLERYGVWESEIRGYIANNGVAYEYFPGRQKSITVERSKDSLEHTLWRYPRPSYPTSAVFNLHNCKDLTIAKLTFDLDGTEPIRLHEDGEIRFIDVGFKINKWNRHIKFAEVFGNRDARFWSRENAENRAMREIFVGLNDVEQCGEASLHEYLRQFKNLQVLVVGDYSQEGLERLYSINEILKSLGYYPILIKDLPEEIGFPYDIRQKFLAVASVVRFIVCDNSSKSGHIWELQAAKTNDWTTVCLTDPSGHPSAMVQGVGDSSNVMKELEYSPQVLQQVVVEGCEWAEATIKERVGSTDESSPWRAGEELPPMPAKSLPWKMDNESE